MTSYNDLLADVPIWLYAQNRDIITEMPKLITDAEDQIFELLDHDLIQVVLDPKTLTKGDPDIDLTADSIREVRSISLGYRDTYQATPLERRSLEFLTMLYTTNRPARPRFYAERGGIDLLRVFPVPREDYTLDITANVFPERLSVSVQTNEISDRFPRVYERAVLRQGALFMKNPADAATYGEEMQAAVMEANASIARRRRDETGTRAIETSNMVGT